MAQRTRLVWLFLLLPIEMASAQECSGPIAWLCEEHQMFNAEPTPTQKFNRGSIPSELLDPNPTLAGKPLSIQPDAATITLPLDKKALATSPCLSEKQVHGGWPKYRIIKGRKCWYASTSPRKNGPPLGTTKQGTSERLSAIECQDQAMKLDGDEKRTFLSQCMSHLK